MQKIRKNFQHVFFSQKTTNVFSFSSHYIFPNRIEINTAANYTLLKQGKIGAAGDIIAVHWPAHPDILSEPIFFWNATKFSEISFTSKSTPFPGDTITLRPSKRSAKALYITSEFALAGIPSNYTSYSLNFLSRVHVPSTVFDRIFQWQDTTSLEILDSDHHQIPMKLTEQIDGLSGLQNLQSLSLMIHKSTFKIFNVRPLLEKLPSLTNMYCRPYFQLGEVNFKEFIVRQQSLLPENWQSRVYIFKGEYRVHLSKKAN